VEVDRELIPPSRTSRQQNIAYRNGVKKQFYIGQLTGTSATLYTAPTAPVTPNSVGITPVAVIENIWISNTDSAARTVTMYLVEAGGSIGTNRAFMSAVSIPANSVVDIAPDFVLETEATIRGLASVTSVVTVVICGTEYT
jgi:hypothetical protein